MMPEKPLAGAARKILPMLPRWYTAFTPGIASARLVSRLVIVPFAIVAHTRTAYSVPGRVWSDVSFALPAPFSGPSTRGSDPLVLGGKVGAIAMKIYLL